MSIMDENREKELARMLGDYLDGDTGAGSEFDADPELENAIDTAHAISGAMDEGPEINPAFDETLRARLAREAGGNAPGEAGVSAPGSLPSEDTAPVAPARPVRPRRWMQLAVAAVLLALIVPASLLVVDISSDARKMKLVEKYDRMYVPYTQKAGSEERGFRVVPFSDSHREQVKRMRVDTLINRTGTDYMNYRREREYGI